MVLMQFFKKVSLVGMNIDNRLEVNSKFLVVDAFHPMVLVPSCGLCHIILWSIPKCAVRGMPLPTKRAEGKNAVSVDKTAAIDQSVNNNFLSSAGCFFFLYNCTVSLMAQLRLANYLETLQIFYEHREESSFTDENRLWKQLILMATKISWEDTKYSQWFVSGCSCVC